MKKNKAQIAMEFLIMVAFSIVIAITLAWVAYHFLGQASEESYTEQIETIGLTVQNEIVLASTVETGYRRNFNIPLEVGGRPLVVSNDQDDFTITYNGADYNFRIPETQGSLSTGQNTITKQGTIVTIS